VEYPEVQVSSRQSDAGVTNKPLMTLAAVLLFIPVVGLLWVGSYAKVEPTVAGFPFFIWYQFAWVFLCSACTATALRLIRIARPRRRGEGR
jgi:membrane protein implicated in regulation of membrane protease activity